MELNCNNCNYGGRPSYIDPCASCDGMGKWEGAYGEPENPDKETPTSVLAPSHYPPSRHGDVISLCLNGDIGFCEGNIIKYVTRWRKKGGIEDLYKAKTYLDRLIRFYKNKPEESCRVA